MKVIHLIGGGDVGGAKTHVLFLLKELGKYINVKLISLRAGKFADDARTLGIDVEVVNSGNIFFDIKKVVRIIKEGGYDLIHSHGAKANVFLLAAKRRTGLPGVTTIHSDYKLDYMHSLYRRLTIGLINSIALRFIGNYITISKNFRNMLVNRKFNPSDIFILYNGMNFSEQGKKYTRHDLIKKFGLPISEDNVIVGIAARLYPVKSIDTIIKAADIVKDKIPSVKFLIGGDGEDRKQLEELAKGLGLSDTVFFLGWLDDPNELMSCVDISVLSSLSESFPYSILEGAKFRKPTISTDVGGIPDLIIDGKTGFLFKPGDYNKLAQLIEELSSDRQKRIEMGENIYNKASEEFSLEVMCKTQLGVYTKIIEKSEAEAVSKKAYDAVISGYYGFHNIGDDALLLSIINDLKLFKPDIRILILSKLPVKTASEYSYASVSRNNVFRIYKGMRESKAFIYGGGNLLQDNTSTRSLLFYLGTVWLAKKLNLKIMFYANGIGPLKKKINRHLTNRIMNKVDVITLREKLSFEELKHLDISKPKVLLTADAALTVTQEDHVCGRKVLESLGLNIGRDVPMIGISLRKYPGRAKINHDKYESTIARLADHFARKHGVMPVLIPMQYPDDLYVLERVSSKMSECHFVSRKQLSVDETYSVISSMEIMIGMRLHALVFAASAGVPMIGLVYDPKIEGFLDYINQPSAGDVKDLEFDRLVKISEDVWYRKEEIKKQLDKDAALLKEKARENAKVAIELINGSF